MGLNIRTRRVALALAALAWGCGDAPETDLGEAIETTSEGSGSDDGDGSTDAGLDVPSIPPDGTAFVRFDLSTQPPALGDAPFPSEVYRGADGRIAFGAIPNPESDAPVWDATRALLATRDGFCTTCNVVFSIDGGFDPDALPDPDAPPTFDDAVIVVDVDPASPEYGRQFPLRAQWEPDAGRLGVRAARGFSLRAATRYAAVVTDAARGDDDLPLTVPAAFAAVRDGAGETAALEPALAELEALGLPRDRVRGLAAFTTEDPAQDLRALRADIVDGPAATVTVDAILDGAALDDVLGVPATPGPGIDRAPAAGTEGTRAIDHASTELVVVGTLAAPRYVTGTGTEIGTPSRDEAGQVLRGPDEAVPFVLIVPTGVDVSALPVVVSQHGFNASRTTGFAIGDTAGRAGFAVLAIDAFQHGMRAASATDTAHALRGDGVSGPDGFAETLPLDVSARTFGLFGAAPDLQLFVGYPLGAFEQFAADILSTVHFVRAGDLAPLRAADPRLADLAFDPARVAFVGNSMGAVVGTAVATAEPELGAFVLDVMPGSIVETLAESGEFRTLSEELLLPQVGVTEPFDEIDRQMLFDPSVDLLRWALEPVDPLALARTFAAGDADILVQLAGHDEVAAPTASESVVAAASIGGDGAFAFAPVEPIALPVVGAPGAPAVAAVRFDGAMHGMLEVHTQPSAWLDPLLPPLSPRPSPVDVANPIDEVHVQIERFLQTFGATGHATIDREPR